MKILRALILLVLVAAAVVAPGILWRDHAQKAGEEALRRLQTWRVSGTTTSRLDVWLERHGAGVSLRALPLEFWADEVEIELHTNGVLHRFAVATQTGAVRPIDAAALALVARIRQDAARTSPP